MRRFHAFLLAIVLIGSFAAAQASPESDARVVPEPIQRVDAIVNNFRKMTVLTNDSDRLDRISRERVEGAVWTLLQENRGRIADLMETFGDSSGRPLTSNIEAFLNKLERPGLYNECDQLAFEDVFETLFQTRSLLPDDVRKRVESHVFAIRRIKPYQVSELRRSGNKFQSVEKHGDTWGDYVSYLNQAYPRAQLLKEYAAILPRR